MCILIEVYKRIQFKIIEFYLWFGSQCLSLIHNLKTLGGTHMLVTSEQGSLSDWPSLVVCKLMSKLQSATQTCRGRWRLYPLSWLRDWHERKPVIYLYNNFNFWFLEYLCFPPSFQKLTNWPLKLQIFYYQRTIRFIISHGFLSLHWHLS